MRSAVSIPVACDRLLSRSAADLAILGGVAAEQRQLMQLWSSAYD